MKHFGFKFFGFLIIGGIGVLINLVVTFLLTEFILGRENYLLGFIIGTLINITYNFITYSLIIFKKRKVDLSRKFLFFMYSIFIVYFQIISVDFLVELLGINWYMIVIIFVIGFLSVLSFLFFKYFIFHK